MKPALLIIANPVAGKGRCSSMKDDVIRSGISESHDVTILFTEYRGHAANLARQALQENYSCVIAAGGDGTVNEVASALVHTKTPMGIIPSGSGNGLARHLHCPMNTIKALKKIASGKKMLIDTLMINNRFAVNVSGMGLDGYVALKFDSGSRRGLFAYTIIALKEFFHYPQFSFAAAIDGKEMHSSAHMIVFANASQFGNAAIIAPAASLSDGMMDIIIVRRPPAGRLPQLLYRLFTGKLKNDAYIKMLQCRKMSVRTELPIHLHIDGEPLPPVTDIDVSIAVNSLSVIS